MYDVLDVCRYIINYCDRMRYSISNLKLQKILYFVQAYFLVSNDDGYACFRETIEAWDLGPVVPKAYHEFKQYGSSNIPPQSTYVTFDENIWDSKIEQYDDNVIREEDKQSINDVVDSFSKYSANQLVEITHRQRPWYNAYKPHKNVKITNSAIEEYFNEQIRQ